MAEHRPPLKIRRTKLRLRYCRLGTEDGHTAPPAERPLRILRLPEVVKRVGLAPMTLWRFEEAGCFPERFPLGGNSVGWFEHEIENWMRKRAAKRGRRKRARPPKPD